MLPRSASASAAPPPLLFTPRAWTFLGAIILCLLLPTLFHPLGADQSLFNLNGDMLLEGRVYYRDIIEMKPPLISFLYAAANFIFSADEYSMRLLDLLLQGMTCLMIVAVVRRGRGSDLMAAIAALCYALIYTAQRYSDLAQAESYTGLFGLGIIWLLLPAKNSARFFVIGLLGGGLWLLKFPLAILLLLPLFADWRTFRARPGTMARHILLIGAGFAVAAGMLLLYLIAGDAWDDFLLVSEFTRGYAMTELQAPGQWLINIATVLPYHLLLDFSPVVLAAVITGIASMRRPRTDGIPAVQRDLLRLCATAFLLLLLTIIIEGKYPGYHFARLFPFGAILAGRGFVILLEYVRRRWSSIGRRWVFPALAVLLLGPFAAYGWRTILPAAHRLAHADTPTEFARYDFSVAESRKIGAYIREHRVQGDELFAAASIGGQIYHHAGLPPMTPIYHFGFINATYGPAQWSDSIRTYLLGSHPRFIVAELADSYPSTTASTLTSSQRLRAFPGVDSLLRASYADMLRLEHLVLYERRE